MLATVPRLTTPRELIERVRVEVDVRLLVGQRLEEAKDFGRYLRGRCLSPSHPDNTPSALYYADGCFCTACGWKADAIDLYRMFHPGTSLHEACEALLAGDYRLVGGPKEQRAQPRPRQLDADQALRYHFALAANLEGLARLERMGFSRSAIQHFCLGWAKVLTRLDLKRDAGLFDPTSPELVWKNGEPYQWQYRFSVPVFDGGRLVQMLYRKSDDRLGGSKIQMEAGAGAQLFNADILNVTDFVVFAEGWGDVIAFWQCGIPAITSTNGAGHWNDAWTDRLAKVRRLYVVGDADDAGQKMVQRFIERLPWAREVQLPHIHGSKGDIRDLYLAGWRKDDFLRLFREADFRAARRVATKGAR